MAHDLLQTYAQRALRQDFGTAETLTLPGEANVTLPNPLAVLPDILSESRDVRVACIHGDLNLENILVDPEARDVRLIDFAMARRDHVLHDLLRLETGVVTWLLPEVLAEAGLPLETIHGLYEQLHCAARLFGHFSAPQRLHPALRKTFVILATIRKMAREYLFDPNDWREYYQGLTLYLLGALKFKNLDDMPQAPLPKQVAFWGAAAIQKLLQEQPPREEMAWQPLTAPIDDLAGQALNRSTAARLRIAGAVLITVVAILLLLGSFGASTLIKRAIAGGSWWEVKPGEVTIAETAVEQNVIEVVRLYLPGVIEDVSLDLAPPDQVDVQGTVFGKEMTLECTLTSADGKIDFEIERLGGIHPYLLGNILSGGVDRGLEIGLEERSLTVEGLEVGERSLTIKYGRMAPTATPRSRRTPTPISA